MESVLTWAQPSPKPDYFGQVLFGGGFGITMWVGLRVTPLVNLGRNIACIV